MTNMDVTGSLFDYFEVGVLDARKELHFDGGLQKNWAPRGTETAQILYNISRGWVTHNEVSIHELISVINALSHFHR